MFDTCNSFHNLSQLCKMVNTVEVLKLVVFLACSAIFGVQLFDIWTKYVNEETFITIKVENGQDMFLPSLTICPNKGYKLPRDKETESQQLDILDKGYQAKHIFLKGIDAKIHR